jgi:hypothetical protein
MPLHVAAEARLSAKGTDVVTPNDEQQRNLGVAVLV